MKKHLSLYILFLINTILIAQNNCIKTHQLVKILSEKHIQPRVVDDEFSEDVYGFFINSLDPQNLYFTSEDEDVFFKHKLEIDNYINNNTCDFISDFSTTYKNRIIKLQLFTNEFLSKPLDYTIDESITMVNTDKNSKINNKRSEVEQFELWKKYLKYQIIQKLVIKKDSLEIDFNKIFSNEETVRAHVLKRVNRKFDRIIKNKMGFDNFLSYEFNRSIAQVFDPHTDYFSASDKNEFEESLSREITSFGLELDVNKKDEIIISELIPGGAAWNSNELNQNDVVLKIKIKDGKEIDVTLIDLEELLAELNISDCTEIELTIRKQSKEIKIVSITQSKVRADDNIIKSFVLNGENKVGYISLPGFYTEWEDDGSAPLGCANDVAKELLKLKKEGIKGLILDLRYNGGGSLYEAINLAGIFIDWGPVYIQTSVDEKPYILKDMNRGKVYNDPLIILVNGLSASASELLSATLQDYNRALIVGDYTFGKSTGQQILPINGKINFSEDYNGDFAKITTSKLFRITTKTHQFVGVKPDIILPDILSNYKINERAYEFALKPDSILKKVYYTSLKSLPKKQLLKKYNDRLKTNNNFQNISRIDDEFRLDLMKSETVIPLNLEEFNSVSTRDYWSEFKKYSENKTSVFKVETDKYMNEITKFDEYTKKLNQKLIDNILKDIYIEESFRIMLDFIKLTNE